MDLIRSKTQRIIDVIKLPLRKGEKKTTEDTTHRKIKTKTINGRT